MNVVIRHYISDPQKWDRTTKKVMALVQQHRLPKGLKPVEYLPSMDGRNADCVWETNSLENLKQFMDGESSGAARNEYFEVKSASAIGLPLSEELVETHNG